MFMDHCSLKIEHGDCIRDISSQVTSGISNDIETIIFFNRLGLKSAGDVNKFIRERLEDSQAAYKMCGHNNYCIAEYIINGL